LSRKAKFCGIFNKAKIAESGISVELPSRDHPFYVMALQILPFSNMELWQRHAKDVATS